MRGTVARYLCVPVPLDGHVARGERACARFSILHLFYNTAPVRQIMDDSEPLSPKQLRVDSKRKYTGEALHKAIFNRLTTIDAYLRAMRILPMRPRALRRTRSARRTRTNAHALVFQFSTYFTTLRQCGREWMIQSHFLQSN